MAHLGPDASAEELSEIFATTKTIAVVGASINPAKAAHTIPRYLRSQGFRIIPVNPKRDTVLGEAACASLLDIDEPIDVVDVFRPPAEAEAVAQDAVAVGAKVVWFQLETETPEAVGLALDAGLTVVTGHCMGATHWELRDSRQ
jgi:uncharacterized protein